MKIRLNHYSLFDIKLLEKKIKLNDFGHLISANLIRLRDAVNIDSSYKTLLVYFSSAISILFLMAFVQVSDFDSTLKIILGVSILSANVWMLKKCNL